MRNQRDKRLHRDRVEVTIQRKLNSFLRSSFNDPRLEFVSITRVELSPDASQAVAYWDTFDVEKYSQVEITMKGVQGKLRSLLAQTLKTKFVPELKIKRDAQFVNEQRISELLSTVQ